MKELFLNDYHFPSKMTNLNEALNIYFSCSEGENFVWKPTWKQETMTLFSEAYRFKEVIEKQIKLPEKHEEPDVRFKNDDRNDALKSCSDNKLAEWDLLAFKAGEALKKGTSLSHIETIASNLFEFGLTSHPNLRINDENSQKVYDWLMTLGKQPYTKGKKLLLAKKFVSAVAPVGHPLKAAFV